MTLPLTVARGLVDRTFGVFRACGHGRSECVAYWVASIDDGCHVVDVVHPRHTSSLASYEVDSEWLTQFFLGLRTIRRKVVAQVHTHPWAAGHSETDDLYSLVPSTGFLSLVLPRFALEADPIAEAILFRLSRDGAWVAVELDEWMHIHD